MEKEINDKEIKLQELIEVKDFEALSSSEKTSVLGVISESEYALRRCVVLSTQEDKQEKIIPLPLILPEKETKVMVMPVYQAMLAVAATIVVMWFLKFPFEKEEVSGTETKVQYVAQIDTIYSEKLLYDTIFKVVERPTIVEKKIYETRTIVEYVNTSDRAVANKVLDAPSYDIVPDLVKVSAEVDGGSSLYSDNTLNLIPDIILRD